MPWTLFCAADGGVAAEQRAARGAAAALDQAVLDPAFWATAYQDTAGPGALEDLLLRGHSSAAVAAAVRWLRMDGHVLAEHPEAALQLAQVRVTD